MDFYAMNERMWDAPLHRPSGEAGRGVKTVPHAFCNIASLLVYGAFKLAFRFKVTGLEHVRALKGEQGAIIFGNHVSYMDPVCQFLSVRPSQWVRFIARDNLFYLAKGTLGLIISAVGAFPVSRDSADLSAVKRAVKHIKAKELVGIFPEGTRRGKGNIPPALHSGGALIARMAKAPIIPSSCLNADKVKPKGKFMRFPKITVAFGRPVYVGDFDFLPKERRLDGCTWYVMRECYGLFLGCAAEEVDMVALFPDNDDFTDDFRGFIPPSWQDEPASDHKDAG